LRLVGVFSLVAFVDGDFRLLARAVVVFLLFFESERERPVDLVLPFAGVFFRSVIKKYLILREK
jgi:hypothetical protein